MVAMPRFALSFSLSPASAARYSLFSENLVLRYILRRKEWVRDKMFGRGVERGYGLGVGESRNGDLGLITTLSA